MQTSYVIVAILTYLLLLLVEIPVAILALPFSFIHYKRTGQFKFYSPLNSLNSWNDQEDQYTAYDMEADYDIDYFEWTDKLSETAVETMFPQKTLLELARDEFGKYRSQFDSAKVDAKTDSAKDDTNTDSAKDDTNTDSAKDDTNTDSAKDDSKTDSPKDDSKTDSPKAEMNPTQITIPQQTTEPVGLIEEKNSSKNKASDIPETIPEPLQEQDISDVDIKELKQIETIDLDNPSSVMVAYGEYSCVVCQEKICCDEKLGPFCKVRMLYCGHIFHDLCIFDWLTKGKASCPICNKTFHSVETS